MATRPTALRAGSGAEAGDCGPPGNRREAGRPAHNEPVPCIVGQCEGRHQDLAVGRRGGAGPLTLVTAASSAKGSMPLPARPGAGCALPAMRDAAHIWLLCAVLSVEDSGQRSVQIGGSSAALRTGQPRSVIAVVISLARLRARLPGRQAECFGMDPAVVLSQDLAEAAGPGATVRRQIWQRVIGRWVTVTGKRRELYLLIASMMPVRSGRSCPARSRPVARSAEMTGALGGCGAAGLTATSCVGAAGHADRRAVDAAVGLQHVLRRAAVTFSGKARHPGWARAVPGPHSGNGVSPNRVRPDAVTISLRNGQG